MSSLEKGTITFEKDSVDGVSVRHSYFNATDKVMKYITFTYIPYNAVGDQVRCTASGNVAVSGELTGPIEPYFEGFVKWKTLWYNPTVTKVVLEKIHIKYMDGSEETINGEDIVSMDSKGSVYKEKIEKPRAEREKIEAEKRAERAKIEAEKWEEKKKIEAEKWAERKKIEAEEQKKAKIKVFSYISLGVSIFFLLGAIFGVDESTMDTLPVLLGISAIGAAAFVLLKFKPELIETIVKKIKELINKKN